MLHLARSIPPLLEDDIQLSAPHPLPCLATIRDFQQDKLIKQQVNLESTNVNYVRNYRFPQRIQNSRQPLQDKSL